MNRGTHGRFYVSAALAVCLAACSGSDGKNGTNGTTCTVGPNDAGVNTISCSDGTSATLGGKVPIPSNDAGATNCTIVSPDGGARMIVCPDGTSVTIPAPASASTGVSCTVVSNGDGTSTMTCPSGDGGVVTTNIKDAVVSYTNMSAAEKAALDLHVFVSGVTVPASGKPVVAFKATDGDGNGVTGLPAADFRFALLKLVPATPTTGGNDAWVSYMAANPTSTASTETGANPGTATNGALTDNGDGTYAYNFAKNVIDAANAGTTYDASATHRLVIRLSESASGAQVFAPINVVKDYVPATGQDVTGSNDKVDGAACLECHSAFRAKAGGTGAFHGGSIYDVRMCAACHNNQQRFAAIPGTAATPLVDLDAAGTVDPASGAWTGTASLVNGDAVLNFPGYIHRIHMGDQLTLAGGNYRGVTQPYDDTYPQDVRNCAKCHRAPASPATQVATQAANFSTKPSRLACGSCHDSISFAAAAPVGRTLHKGGPQTDDSKCTTCHPSSGAKTQVTFGVLDSHVAVAEPDSTATWLGGTNANTNAGYLPAAGAIPAPIAYNLKSVTRDANKHPSIVFRFMTVKTNTPVVFNAYAAGAGVDGGTGADGGTGTGAEMMTGFVNSPSMQVAYAIPQDGIPTPADFNVQSTVYIKNIWNGTATGASAGTLTGPDATGYYTITLTGITVPDTATMLTCGIGYGYSLSATPPLTEIDLPAYPYGDSTVIKGCVTGQMCGGLIVVAPDVSMVATDATSGTAYTARRPIVSTDNCKKCHEQLGANPTFHAGQRNDAPTCAFCHNPNRTSSGWSASSSTFIHSIHGSSIRTVGFNWHAACPAGTSITDGSCTASNADSFANITYPGILNNCQQCHLAGTYDFSATASAAALPNLLMSTVAANPSSTTLITADITTAPYVTPGTDYGLGFTTGNITTGTQNGVACTTAAPCVCSLTAPCQATSATLVKSPITAACSACHDSPTDLTHMQQMGGSFYQKRSLAMVQTEQCMLCHGPGRVAAIADVHK